jgi:hypothetical protein
VDFLCPDPGSSRGPSHLLSDALPTERSRLVTFAQDASGGRNAQAKRGTIGWEGQGTSDADELLVSMCRYSVCL